MHGTARHVVQQHYRRSQREQRAFGKVEGEGADHSTNPLDDLISEQRRAEVRRALEGLEHADRMLLVWVYHEGVDAPEAAARLGVGAGTLRVRKHRALQRLGALLRVATCAAQSFSPRTARMPGL